MTNDAEPKTSLQVKQETLAELVRMLARKLSASLFIHGIGGTGKTLTVMKVLEEEGIEPIIINSHITPLALALTLHQHRSEEVIIFDDCDAMYSSMPCLGLLRSALWGSPRLITWNSSSRPDSLPQSWEFDSQCIFISNTLPPKSNGAFHATLSRCDTYELSASNSELIDHFRFVSRNGFHEISPDECERVIDFIEEHSDERQLSMRLLGPSLRKYKYARDEHKDWQRLVLSQLEALGQKPVVTKRLDNRERDLKVVRESIRKHPDSTAEQCNYFMAKLNKSRASFYRSLKRLKAETT